MKYNNKQQAVLLLKDGTIFYGKSIGISGKTFGEVCFNTGMTGYQEIFTDPSYFGQIMVATNPHIGNYGVNTKEVESDSVKISGLVCKNFSMNYSREDASESLYDYLEKQNLIVISDVDTRALVSYIRDNGAMNAIISTDGTSIEDLKVKLEHARKIVDAYAKIPQSQRTSQQLDHAILTMFSVWDNGRELLNELMAQSKSKDSKMSNYFISILILTDMRDQAGRVASNVMAPITFSEKISDCRSQPLPGFLTCSLVLWFP